jgi:hypothetical protein
MMSKKLQVEFDELSKEEARAFRDSVNDEKNSLISYREKDMIMYDFHKDDNLGEYPGVEECETEHNSIFGIHPSMKLQDLYKSRYWQGQSPDKAKVIFLGLDANWDKDIENNEAFNKIVEYLQDGVSFWERYGVHHPFLLPEYKKKSGYRYHKGFAKLGIDKMHASEVSFVELINKPTYGTSTKEKNEYMSLINADYIKELNDKIFDNRRKIVFLSKSLYDDILRVKKITNSIDIFNFGLPIEKNRQCMNRILNIHNIGETFVFVCTHFSAAIKNDHISDIGIIIKSFLSNEEKLWWKIGYEGTWNGELVNERRYVFAKNVFDVKDVLCRHLNQYRVERDFLELEFKPVKEELVERQFIWD